MILQFKHIHNLIQTSFQWSLTLHCAGHLSTPTSHKTATDALAPSHSASGRPIVLTHGSAVCLFSSDLLIWCSFFRHRSFFKAKILVCPGSTRYPTPRRSTTTPGPWYARTALRPVLGVSVFCLYSIRKCLHLESKVRFRICACVIKKQCFLYDKCLSRLIKSTFVSFSTSSRPPLMPTQSLSLISVYASVWLWLLHSQSVVWVLVAGRQHYDIPGAQISIWALTRFHSCFSLERTFGPPPLASHTDRGPALFATTEAKLQYCHSSWAPIIPLNTPCVLQAFLFKRLYALAYQMVKMYVRWDILEEMQRVKRNWMWIFHLFYLFVQ